MSTSVDPSSGLHASKRKRTRNLLPADYPVTQPNSPVVAFFGCSTAASSSAALSAAVVAPTSIASRSSAASSRSRSRCPSPQNPEASAVSSSADSSAFSWSFLEHPVLQDLRKWPGLSSNPPTTVAAAVVAAAAPGASASESQPAGPPLPGVALEWVSHSQPLDLLGLFDIPPVAASLASNLYGHDLFSLRLLNSTFYSLLSSRTRDSGTRSYYHTLLLKSLLCPREDVLISEPVGFPCASIGGNVGPCAICKAVICNTCISPEIWTTSRYRYICPPCCVPVASLTAEDTCRCQDHLWICRPCYKVNWLADLFYDYGNWINERGAASCSLCQATHTPQSDPRLPASSSSRVGAIQFREWCVKDAPPPRGKVRHGKAHSRLLPPPPPTDDSDAPKKRRPVGCAWCTKRVDPRREAWLLRPMVIRRGEEKGRIWMDELERRRRVREHERTADAESEAETTP